MSSLIEEMIDAEEFNAVIDQTQEREDTYMSDVDKITEGNKEINWAEKFERRLQLTLKLRAPSKSAKAKPEEYEAKTENKNAVTGTKQLYHSKEILDMYKVQNRLRSEISFISDRVKLSGGIYCIHFDLVDRAMTEIKKCIPVLMAFKEKARDQLTYERWLDDSRKALTPFFVRKQYPATADQFADKWDIEWLFAKVIGLTKDDGFEEYKMAEVNSKLEDIYKNAVEGMNAWLGEELLAEVDEWIERMSEPVVDPVTGKVKKKVIKQSALDRTQDYLSIFKLKNISGNETLNDLVDELWQMFQGRTREGLQNAGFDVRKKFRERLTEQKVKVQDFLVEEAERNIIID